MKTYNDDEQIDANKHHEHIKSGQGVAVTSSHNGRVEIKIDRREDITNQATIFPVLVEVIGTDNSTERMGVDIVAVLDVSESMEQQHKLDKMKRAMNFVIRKLSLNDRLSIVQFSTNAKRLCKLRQMTTDAKVQLGALVQNLDVIRSTNTAAGLNKALKVLNDRKHKTGRAVAIMLMSDGDQDKNSKAENIHLGDIPVHTFGFGSGLEYNPTTLNKIAKNSTSGTFAYAEVKNTDKSNLSTVFSQCVAGLHSIVVQELKVTIAPREVIVHGIPTKSVIHEVFAGDYVKTENPDGSVTILFGDLYQEEVRKIVVEIRLPTLNIKEHEHVETTFIGVSRTFKVDSRVNNINPTVASITRTRTPSSKESDALKVEILRIETLDRIHNAIEMAEQTNFKEATKILITALRELDKAKFDKPHASIDALKQEVHILMDYMQHGGIYEEKGRVFGLSTKTSHARQRFAGRGDHVGIIRSHATPRMGTLFHQAEAFEQNRNLEHINHG